MYDVWLYKRFACTDGDLHMQRYITLPFVPHAGMMLNFTEEGEDQWINWASVQHVEWHLAGEVFWVQCEPSDEAGDTVEEEMAYNQELGWELEGKE